LQTVIFAEHFDTSKATYGRCFDIYQAQNRVFFPEHPAG